MKRFFIENPFCNYKGWIFGSQSFGKTNEEIIKNRMDITIRNVTESMLTPK